MRKRNRNRAILLSIACFGLMFIFCSSFVYPSGSGAAVAPPTAPKYVIDVATLSTTKYTLKKTNKEWIRWTNSSSQDLSVYFLSHDSPFDKDCWDVPSKGTNRTNKITVPASTKEYDFDKSDKPCSANPGSNDRTNTPKVIIQ